jgi:hypothetical protein
MINKYLNEKLAGVRTANKADKEASLKLKLYKGMTFTQIKKFREELFQWLPEHYDWGKIPTPMKNTILRKAEKKMDCSENDLKAAYTEYLHSKLSIAKSFSNMINTRLDDDDRG